MPGDRRRTLDPDPALVAGAVASARGVDRDAVPRRGVEDGHSRGDAHLALGVLAWPKDLHHSPRQHLPFQQQEEQDEQDEDKR